MPHMLKCKYTHVHTPAPHTKHVNTLTHIHIGSFLHSFTNNHPQGQLGEVNPLGLGHSDTRRAGLGDHAAVRQVSLPLATLPTMS